MHACLHMNCLQEPDPGIMLPVMSFTIISFPMVLMIITIYSIPQKLKVMQVLYRGGGKVSLPMCRSPCLKSTLSTSFSFLSQLDRSQSLFYFVPQEKGHRQAGSSCAKQGYPFLLQ